MKRVMYICGALVLISSFAFSGGHSFAARASAKTLSLKLCMSYPAAVPSYAALAAGAQRGARLAIKQWKSKLKKVHVNLGSLRFLDDSRADASEYSTDKERVNALTVIADKSCIAYLAPLNSGASKISMPIINREGMVMISGSNTNRTITDPANRKTYEPVSYGGHRTYYRTVTTDGPQGAADALYANKKLKVKNFYLIDDKTLYGAGLASVMDSYGRGKCCHSKLKMKRLGIGHLSIDSIDKDSATQSDLILARKPSLVFCGCDTPSFVPFARVLRRKGYKKVILSGDANFTDTTIKELGTSLAANIHVSSVGPDPAASSKPFRKAWKKAYGNPGFQPYDASTYDAASIELTGLYKAAKAGKLKGSIRSMRRALIPYTAKTHLKGALGLTTFDSNGDTNNTIVSLYAVKGSKFVYKGRETPKGVKKTSPS